MTVELGCSHDGVEVTTCLDCGVAIWIGPFPWNKPEDLGGFNCAGDYRLSDQRLMVDP